MTNGSRPTIGRRHALKLAGSAGITLATSRLTRAATAGQEGYDIIVVGAGMAGLYAARELLLQGYKVLVLEASNRHGGRINTKSLGSTRIEMGAEEHYLAKNNPIHDAVIGELGADAYTRAYPGDTLLSMTGGMTCWENTGSCEDDPDIVDYWNYWSHYANRGKQKDFSITMADDVMARYGVDKSHRAYHLYDSGIAGSIYGASLDRIGAASVAEQDWHWTLSDYVLMLSPAGVGYVDVLNRIWWKDVLPYVELNKPVTDIDTTGDHVVVKDANGDQYRAHKVIVTASVGVLQSETIRFTPELPDSTVEAYNNIGMGRGMKVALRFSKQFWQSKMAYLVTEGLSCSCWVPSSYKKGTDDHIVMCYPMGDNGQKLTDLASANGGGANGDTAIVKVMLRDLDQVFAGAASAGFIDAVVQDWTAEPFVRGSYSYPMLATYEPGSPSKRQNLATPIAECLFFAGEATNHNNAACVPGALQEGARAAKQIHELLGGVSNPPTQSS